MGLFKIIGLFSGLPIRPTTGRERSRMYQRQANDLLEEQLYAIQNLSQQQVTPFPNDTRPRGTCPACHELMIVGASMCPHCQTKGIFWPETKVAAEQSLIPLSELQKDYERNRQLNTNAKPKRGKLFRRVQSSNYPGRVQSSDYRIVVESESEKLNRIRKEKEARKPENLKNYTDKVRETQSKKLGGKLSRRVQIIEPEKRNAVESESERPNPINQEKEARRPANVKNYADKVREAQSKKLGG